MGRNPIGPSGYCTYTLQALAWRDGQICLSQDYPWLELAIYQGKYFVSFPPVPSVPLYFLTFLFGEFFSRCLTDWTDFWWLISFVNISAY